MTDTIDETMELTGPTGFSRRKLFIGGGVGALAVVVAACGSDDDNDASAGDPTTTTTKSPSSGGGDAAVAGLAASLELLAVNTYTAAAGAASAGDLGPVPPAVGAFVGRALEQHQAALDAWNGVLTDAGGDEVTETPADLQSTVDTALGKVTDATGAAKLALLLERTASDTYCKAVPTLEDKAAITLAGSLQIACQEHAAILHYVLGEYPVPDVFQTTKNAYPG